MTLDRKGDSMTTGASTGEGAEFLSGARDLQPRLHELLRRFVEVESPTGDVEANHRMAHVFREALESRGMTVARREAPGYGEHLVARLPAAASRTSTHGGGSTPDGEATPEGREGAEDSRPVLVLGHMDTVHPLGTLETLPFEHRGDTLRGPGIFDMKGGWACFLAALDLLAARGSAPSAPLLILVTSDEEVGSPTSRNLIEEAGRACRACLVLEPSLPGGAVKIRRKGTGEGIMTVTGRAAHAGIEPEAGASAIHEMARQILAVTSLADPEKETHVNVGLVRGGTGANVVAARAEASVDFRFWTREEAERLEAGMAALAPVDSRCTVRLEGGVNRLALEPSPGSEALYALARGLSAEMGTELGAGGTGGASDGNLTAAVGCPTLDGLGPEGGGAHSPDEHVLVDRLPFRVALLARLLGRV